MGRSFFRLSPSNAVEDLSRGEYYHSASQTYYSTLSRGGAYYQRRWQKGFDGRDTHLEESRIDYVLGSGNHARSYLHRTARGTLIELPLGWYAENGGSWGMSPGFDSPHPATRRLISFECMFCHNGYPRIPDGHEAPGSEPVFTGDLPEGIDCQRCHGPGSNHVRAAQTGRTVQQIRTSIVNPARLSPKSRMEICMQCHLQPSSSSIPALIRRFNRAPFSYVAGEPLSDFVLAFDHAPGTYDEKFEIVGSSAYRLRKSRCFRESGESLTCETCHDPHRPSRGEDAARRYSAACNKCHAAGLRELVTKGSHPSSADCTGCHMPKRRTEDVVHAVMTDHFIQRRPSSRDQVPETSAYRGEVVPYYPPALSSTGEEGLYRALAQVLMKNNLGAGVAELARLLALQPSTQPEWYLQLGDAWHAAGDPGKARAAYEHALRLKPDEPRALLPLAKPIRASPSDARSWYQAGVLSSQAGQPAAAIAKLTKAAELDPDVPGVYTTLAGVHAGIGEHQQAQAALQQALRIDPCDAAAWDLAGRVLAEKREFPEALFSFEKAIRYRPNFGPYLYDYALTLASSSQFERAQEAADAALKAEPKLAEAHLLLGGLLARKRQLPQAAREYEEALRLRPDFLRARLDLASVLLAQGDRTVAVLQLREAAAGNDPEIARLAAAALGKLGERF